MSHLRRALPQDVIAEPSTTERCARAIFESNHPRVDWSNPLYRIERENCLLLAAQFKEMFSTPAHDEMPWAIPTGALINDQWRQAFVATKFCEVMAALTPGLPFLKLGVEDRSWLRGQIEEVVGEWWHRMTAIPGDPEYRPQDEPEYDFDGRTESERE